MKDQMSFEDAKKYFQNYIDCEMRDPNGLDETAKAMLAYVKTMSRLEQPQVANDEALEAFDRMMGFIDEVVTRHSGSWHINDFGSKSEIKSIRQALTNAQPKTVDVGKIKKSYSMRNISQEYNEGYNQCLDDLIQEGIINANDMDFKGALDDFPIKEHGRMGSFGDGDDYVLARKEEIKAALEIARIVKSGEVSEGMNEALAKSFHPEMEGQAVEYLWPHFFKAMSAQLMKEACDG